MAIATKRQVLEGIRGDTRAQETGEGVRIAQGRFLDELPGIVFAILTVVWIVSSFVHLTW